jgi:hypothetical protein
MEKEKWELLNNNSQDKVFKNQDNNKIKIIYSDGREVIRDFDWNQDDLGK